MEKFEVHGGKKLKGTLEIGSSKNACLPILACSVMCNGIVKIKNCATFSDVDDMQKILEGLGAKITYNDSDVIIDLRDICSCEVDEKYTKKIRSSIFMLGPLLARLKKAVVAYPGGCNIGNRPIDLHLKGLRGLGVKIIEKHGFIYCDGSDMKSSEIYLDFPSVGATENILMASVCLEGTTTIYNCAKEPEIEDLQNFINAMGGKVHGAGSSTITIDGVKNLHSVEYKPISDRVIAGTYLIACAMTGGDVELKNVNACHNFALISKLKQSGCQIDTYRDKIHIRTNGNIHSVGHIETQPYPGYPTDLQSQFLTLMTVSDGTCVIVENLFENRFNITSELHKMGADIKLVDRMAIVKGVSELNGAKLMSSDLRGGASLVIAGLRAKGYTTIENIYHIDRGYYHIENDLTLLGADIKRIVD